jgi:hypothetical protein
MAASAVFLFAFVLAEQFAPLVGLFRSAEAQQQTAIWAYSAQCIRAFVFAGMAVLLHGRRRLPVTTGATYGLLAGLFVGTFHVANTASLPLPFETGVAWVAFDTGLLVLGGTVFAAAYRPGDAVT